MPLSLEARVGIDRLRLYFPDLRNRKKPPSFLPIVRRLGTRAEQYALALDHLAVQGVVVRPGSGALNEIEAKAVVKELERLCIQQGYSGTVGVVTPFRAQANRIRDLVNAHPHASLLLNKLELLIDIVHKFQGDERDVMIFSPVVSRGISDGAVGFLKKTDNLFNVAITRARAALIVVGDPAAAKNAGVTYLAAFANYIETLGQNPRRQPGSGGGACSGPEYPKVAKPELVSDWERVFYRQLWEAGLRPIPQYAEEKFLLDFALFAEGRKLNIEVDGERYHRDWNGELLRRDQLRNMRLIELGWDVMRFWVYQLRDETHEGRSDGGAGAWPERRSASDPVRSSFGRGGQENARGQDHPGGGHLQDAADFKADALPLRRTQVIMEGVARSNRPTTIRANMRPLWKGITFALLSALLFGASTPLAKLLLPQVAAMLMAGLLYLGCGVGLAAYALLRVCSKGLGSPEAALTRRVWP